MNETVSAIAAAFATLATRHPSLATRIFPSVESPTSSVVPNV